MTTTVIDRILAVFTAIGNWISTTIPTLEPMFYDSETGLTLLGTMCVVSVGFGVIFLLLGIIQKFIGFRA